MLRHFYTGHKVLPGKVEEYKEVVGEYNTRLADTKDIDVKLTGSWETAVGELDTFCKSFSMAQITLSR